MNTFVNILAFLSFVALGNALKCYNGAASSVSEYTCPSGADKGCQTVDTAGVKTYACSATTTTGCSTVSSIETCVCNTDLCNTAGDGNSGSSGSGIKCWTGVGDTKTETTCSSGACSKAVAAGIETRSCGLTTTAGCNEALGIETCICTTELCNSAEINAGKWVLAALATLLFNLIV